MLGVVDRLRDWHQVLDGIVGHFGVKTGIDGELSVRRYQKGVTIGRCLGDAIASDVAAGAGNIFDDHRLAPDLAQLVAHDPRDYVHRSCRWISNDHSDRAVRVTVLCMSVACC
jgi:hypothetical protein